MRNINSFKEGPGDTALKKKSFQNFPGVHGCGKILRAQSTAVGILLGCAFNWVSEMGTSCMFLSYWCSVGSVMFQFWANSSSVQSYWSVRDFLDLVLAFLVTAKGKHGQADPGILQGKPKHEVIFRSDFLKCLLKKLSLLCIRMNLAIRSLYK